MGPTARRRLGEVLGVAALALALSEAAARLLHTPEPVRRVYDPFAYRIPAPGLRDSFRNREGRTIVVQLNELGMRGPSASIAAPPGALTLVFLGGSTTENYAYEEKDTFPVQVGSALESSLGRPVRTWNAGMSAATSATTLARLQHQVLDLQPDLVIVMDGINDLLQGFHRSYRMDGRHLERPPLADQRPRSYLLDWLRHGGAARPPTRKPERHLTDYESFPARRAFARNVRSIAAIAEAHGVDVLFLTMATMYRDAPDPGDTSRFVLRDALGDKADAVPDVASLAAGMRAFNAVILALPRSDRVHVFDLAARLPQSSELFYDDCHLTLEGNRRAATLILAPVRAALQARLSR